MQDCESCQDVVRQYPLLAFAVSVVVGAGAYAAISLMMRNTVDPVEVGLFAVVFAGVNVMFSRRAETIGGWLRTN